MGRKKMILVGTTLLVAVIGGWKYKIIKSANSQPQYQTAAVERGTLVVSVSSSGTVLTNYAPAFAQTTGVVTEVYVQNGQKVRAGSKLVEIELNQESKQKYLQALASYQSAKNNLESAKNNLHALQSKAFSTNQKLINDAVARNLDTTDPTYIQQNADWLGAEADYKNQTDVIYQSQLALDNSAMQLGQASGVVYSPIAGTVAGLTVQKGQIISTEQKVASIRTEALPALTVNLTEIDVPKVKTGDKATVTIEALGGKTFTGKVMGVDVAGVTSSGVVSYPAIILLDSQNDNMLPSMAGQASIITQTKDSVLLVPSSAVQSQNGQSFVRLFKDGQVELAQVETGLVSDSQVEIVSGITEGDTVITGNTVAGGAAGQSASPFGGGMFRTGSFHGGTVRIAR